MVRTKTKKKQGKGKKKRKEKVLDDRMNVTFTVTKLHRQCGSSLNLKIGGLSFPQQVSRDVGNVTG